MAHHRRFPTGSAAAAAVCASKQRKPILQLLPSTLGLLGNACRGGVCCANTGGVAQLGERLLCKQEVDGSSPFTSTSLAKQDWWASGETQFRRKPPPPMKAQLSSRGGSAYRADRGLRQQTLKGEVPKARHQLYHPLRRGSGTELAPKLLYWEGGVGC